MAVLRIILLCVTGIVIGGCVSSQPMRFSAVSVSAPPSKALIVQEGVVGEDCPEGTGSYGSYAEATRKAISSVPHANALVNAQFSRVEKPVARICVTVTGDAATL